MDINDSTNYADSVERTSRCEWQVQSRECKHFNTICGLQKRCRMFCKYLANPNLDWLSKSRRQSQELPHTWSWGLQFQRGAGIDWVPHLGCSWSPGCCRSSSRQLKLSTPSGSEYESLWAFVQPLEVSLVALVDWHLLSNQNDYRLEWYEYVESRNWFFLPQHW